MAPGSSIISSGCRRAWAPKCAEFQGLAEVPSPAPDPSWGWPLCPLGHPAFHQSSGGHIHGSSNQHFYCNSNYYLLSACVCQALCLHYLNPPHNPVKLPAGWCGLWFSPILEYFLGQWKPCVVKFHTRTSAWRGSHLFIPERWHPGRLPSTLG